MRLLSLLALGALALVSASNVDSFPADVQAGFFPGRSGDVIIKPINNEPRDMMAMFVDNHNFLTSASAPSSLLDLADVALRTVGASPIHSEGAAASFVNANAFDRAAAHITLAVESLGQNSVSNDLPHLQSLASAVSSPLSYNVYPADAVSVSASLATGEVPASHGLVARAWSNSRGQTVRALSTEGVKNGARVANVADLVAQSFQGQSLTLSLSADDQLAAAHCVNPSLAKQHPEWNNFCVSFERSSGVLSATAPAASVDSLVSALPSVLRRVSEDSVAVRLNNGEEVTLSLRVESEAALLRELASMVTLADKLNGNAKLSALVRDDTPDVYTLTISSLSGVMKQYGSDSNKVSAALSLVDACVPVILQRLSTLYHERVVSQVVLMGSASFPALDTNQQKALATKLNVKSLMNTFPYAYVSAVQRSSSTCELLNRRIESLGLQAYCAVSMPGYETMALDDSLTATNTTYPTDSEVRRYQIVLWFSILLAFITIAAAFSIPCMDFKKDTLLYTTFNPTGGDDKRRH